MDIFNTFQDVGLLLDNIAFESALPDMAGIIMGFTEFKTVGEQNSLHNLGDVVMVVGLNYQMGVVIH